MNVLFRGESFDARHYRTTTQYVQPGDIMNLSGHLFKVETVQRGCPTIESLKPIITSWVLLDEFGSKHYTRDLFGLVEIYRPRRKRSA